MQSVEVIVSTANDLPAVLASMREWLDHQRYQTSRFRYSLCDAGAEVVVVTFTVENHAVDFANTFGGRLVPLLGT